MKMNRQERQEEDKLFEKIKAFDALSENNYFLLADVFKRQIESGDYNRNSLYTLMISINDLCDTIRMVDIFFDKENFIDVCFKNASEKVLKYVSDHNFRRFKKAFLIYPAVGSTISRQRIKRMMK